MSLRERAKAGAEEEYPVPSKCAFHSNGDVTLGSSGLRSSISQCASRRTLYIPSKAVMAGWKGRLFQCGSVEEGVELIAELKLTVPKIRAFARYLGGSLRGCRYLKAEIVRWLINASLGAKLRAKALMHAVQEKKEVKNAGLFHDFADSSYVVNRGSKFTFGGAMATFGPVSRLRRIFALRVRQPVPEEYG